MPGGPAIVDHCGRALCDCEALAGTPVNHAMSCSVVCASTTGQV